MFKYNIWQANEASQINLKRPPTNISVTPHRKYARLNKIISEIYLSCGHQLTFRMHETLLSESGSEIVKMLISLIIIIYSPLINSQRSESKLVIGLKMLLMTGTSLHRLQIKLPR